jgi:hypothetical protein
MEFRWLTPEEQRSRTVESNSLAEVLSLAQKLQADGEALVSEEQAVDMGRELGIRPEYIWEALRLRRRSSEPPPRLHAEPTQASSDHPRSTIARAATVGFGLGTLPLAMEALSQCNALPVSLFVLIAVLFSGWTARLPRLAGKAGALAAPAVVIACLFYNPPGLSPQAFFFSLVSLTPLGAAVGRAAATVRHRKERLGEQQQLTASRS